MICIALKYREGGDQNRTWKEEKFSCSENTNKPFSPYNLPFSDLQTGKTKKQKNTMVVFS